MSEFETLAMVATRSPHAIFCLLTALQFHELTTQLPREIWIAMPRGSHTPKFDYPPLKLVKFSNEAYSLGIEDVVRDGVKLRLSLRICEHCGKFADSRSINARDWFTSREIMSHVQSHQAANPFIDLPDSGNFVLSCDEKALNDFDEKHKKHERNKEKLIRRDRLPEPRQGPIDAKLFILQANPSFQNGDASLRPEVIKDTHRRLLDEHSLHQGFDTENPWWRSRYRWLIEEVGEKLLAKSVCSVELFAYPSAKFGHSKPSLPSSYYQRNIVNRALDRGAIIVVTRSWSDWTEAVPRLKSELDNTVFRMNSPQNVCFSPTNFAPGVFEKIRDILVGAGD